MTKAEDHAKGDPTLEYCCHCARPDGSMNSYEETLMGMTGFITRTQGLDEAAARDAAKAMMANLPAWKDR
jgi:hypothetical protein